MTASKMNPANAKNTKGVAKKAIAKAPVELAAEAKLSVEDSVSTGPLGSAFHAQVVADSDGGQSGGGMGSTALILGGIALAGGIAVAAAGGGKDTDTNTVPIPTPTPPQPLPSYTVAASATSVDEGKSITFTITDANKVAGQKVTWSVNSERAGDIEGPTSGEVTIDQTGKATVTIAVKEDATTETAAESLTFTVGSQSASATINDTSKTPPPAAKTFTLTTGVDAGNAFVGGAGDDVFAGTDSTVTLGDSIDGGTGSDKLTIISAAGTDFPAVKTVGVETYQIQALVTGASLGLNNGTTDVTAVNFVDGLNDATAVFALSNLALTTGVGISNSGNQITATYNGTAANTADAVTLTLNKSLANAAFITAGSVNQVNIVSNGTANTLAAINDDTATDLTKFTVTGAGDLTITAALEAQVSSFDASAATGKISLKTTDVNSGQDATVSSVDVTDITIKGGSAADTINISANDADNEVSVDAGAGDDVVIIKAATAYSAATTTNAGDSIVGGAGTDTLSVGGNLDALDLSKAISGFETIKFTGSANGTDMSVNKLGITDFQLSGTNTAVALSGLTATTTVKISDDGSNLTASLAALGTADTLTVTLESTSATGTALIANSHDVVNIVSTKASTDAATVVNELENTTSATSAATLNISGDTALTIQSIALKASADVTSTSSANVTSTFSTALKSYTGGAAKDDVTLAAGSLTATGTYNGGAGSSDVLKVTASDAQNLGIINVSNFETLQLTAGATASTTAAVDLRNVTGLNTLTLTAGAVGTNAFTVERLASTTAVSVATAISTINTTLNSGSSVALKLTDATAVTGSIIGTFNVDGATTSVTVTADDGDTTAAELGAAVDFVGSALATINVLGSDHVNLNTAAATVTKIDGSASTGGFTVTADNATGTTILGSSVVDTITGGAGADVITGGKGADVLDGSAGADKYVFAATGALNGNDTITMVAGAAGDKLDFSAFLSGGAVVQNGALGTGITAFTTGVNDVNIAGKVVLYSDATEANVDEASEIAALIEGAGDTFSLTSGGKGIIIVGDAGGANDKFLVWFVDDSLGANAGKIEADDVVQVAISSAAFDLDTLTTANFTFA